MDGGREPQHWPLQHFKADGHRKVRDLGFRVYRVHGLGSGWSKLQKCSCSGIIPTRLREVSGGSNPEDLVVVIAVVVVGVGLGLAAGITTEAVDPCVVSPQSLHVKTILAPA